MTFNLELDGDDIYLIAWLLDEVADKIEHMSTAERFFDGGRINECVDRMHLLYTKIAPSLEEIEQFKQQETPNDN